MEQAKFYASMKELKREALETYRASTPVKTGYQKEHIFARDLPNGGFEIVVDTDYVQYTTDPWTVGINPNEGWDDEAAAHVIQRAKTKLNGRIQLRSDK